MADVEAGSGARRESGSRKTLKVVSNCADLDRFVSVFSRFYDGESMFLLTRGTKPAGTAVAVLMCLRDGKPIFRFEGNVAGCYSDADSPFGRPGMKIRIDRVDPKCKHVADRLRGPEDEPSNVTQPEPGEDDEDDEDIFDQATVVSKPEMFPDGMSPQPGLDADFGDGDVPTQVSTPTPMRDPPPRSPAPEEQETAVTDADEGRDEDRTDRAHAVEQRPPPEEDPARADTILSSRRALRPGPAPPAPGAAGPPGQREPQSSAPGVPPPMPENAPAQAQAPPLPGAPRAASQPKTSGTSRPPSAPGSSSPAPAAPGGPHAPAPPGPGVPSSPGPQQPLGQAGSSMPTPPPPGGAPQGGDQLTPWDLARPHSGAPNPPGPQQPHPSPPGLAPQSPGAAPEAGGFSLRPSGPGWGLTIAIAVVAAVVGFAAGMWYAVY